VKYRSNVNCKTRNGEVPSWLFKKSKSKEKHECIIWPFSKTGNGYGKLRYNGKFYLAHRLMCELKHGKPKNEKLEASHSCGNKYCVNPNHLTWKTHKQNEADKIKHGTLVLTAIKNSSVCNPEMVRQIRKIGKSQTGRELAKKFGISPQQISSILARKTWAWLD
jgi:hypothetical protein